MRLTGEEVNKQQVYVLVLLDTVASIGLRNLIGIEVEISKG
ncbi:hypothetical protein GCM10010982_26230 [Bowmanella pacifica]|uniref:Uncharacterized protein n=1 Tax=Bowmanella pacifica TaxID=502051 RepID=A0A917Z2F3_9ALTE|nr:hypothetical protein GCM10010982_26230 [Bowmanella pacifica]